MNSEYWVWLQQVLGTASDTVHNVVNEYGDAKAFYLADDDEKIKKCRLSKVQAERLHKVSRRTVYNILRDCRDNNIRIVTPVDDEYPEKLWAIPDAPSVLYVKGNKLNLDGRPSIAIVGPRKVSDYGSKCANVIAGTLASCGFAVISGGALGGDSAAHLGAIDADGYTVAVLGGGILSGYLKSNQDLRDRIAEKGCLVSEDPPFKTIQKGTFPRRNRIMSGLSDGVVIIEGGKKSGTLLTARHANEQGRDVFVIPGSPSLPQYEGSNRLLNDSAKPLLQINDIIDEYLYIYPKVIQKLKATAYLPEVGSDTKPVQNAVAVQKEEIAQPEYKIVPDLSGLSDNAKILLEAVKKIDNKTFYTDDAIDKTDLDAGTVLAALTELEIFGIVQSLPGGMYSLN